MTNPHLPIAVVGLHGRGQGPDVIDGIRRRCGSELRWIAPSADGGQWYPFRFMDPRPPGDTSLARAMDVVDACVATLGDEGYPPDRVVVLGFSQGACLAAQWALGRSTPVAGLALLTGGYLGTASEPPAAGGRWDERPVLVTTRQDDPWVPLDRVRETEAVFRDRGAIVTALFEPPGEHEVSAASIALLERLLIDAAR